MSDKTPKASSENAANPDAQTKLLSILSETLKIALRKAPSEHTGIIQLAWIIAVICWVVTIALIAKDFPYPAIGTFVIGVGFVGFAMFLIRPQKSATEQPSTSPVPASSGVQWSRVTLKLPLTQPQINQLEERLQAIRSLAQTQYAALLGARAVSPSSVNVERLRINIFLPDTRDASYGEICALYIPRGLHHGMTNVNERRVRFRPNEGLTGRVFSLEKAYGALRNSADTDWQLVLLEGLGGIGDEQFRLTLEQTELIDPELRWIICFPLTLTTGSEASTCGVLNIDGLSEPLTAGEMQSIYQKLKDEARRFASELAKLAQCRITITVEDIKTAAVV